MLLEIIATHLTDAITAAKSGADRLELSPGMSEEGLTPSYGLIDEVVHAVDIPVNVIIRPHSQSFCYDANDIKTMVKDIHIAKKLGAAGIVIGTLKPNGEIDTEALKHLLEAADGLDVTFHRAFDFARDQSEALHVLSQFPQVRRVLTSGGKQKAPQGVDNLNELLAQAKQTHVTIMAGHGLTLETFAAFIEKTAVREVHFGSGVRVAKDYHQPISRDTIKQIKKIMADA